MVKLKSYVNPSHNNGKKKANPLLDGFDDFPVGDIIANLRIMRDLIKGLKESQSASETPDFRMLLDYMEKYNKACWSMQEHVNKQALKKILKERKENKNSVTHDDRAREFDAHLKSLLEHHAAQKK